MARKKTAKKAPRKPAQTEMKRQPKVVRPKSEVHASLDRAAKALDTARAERLAAQAEEKEAEDKCNALMEGLELETYQLADGRILRYGPKSTKMGCKFERVEDEHVEADRQGSLTEVA